MIILCELGISILTPSFVTTLSRLKDPLECELFLFRSEIRVEEAKKGANEHDIRRDSGKAASRK